MTPHPSHEQSAPRSTRAALDVAEDTGGDNILCRLIEALACPSRYSIVQRGGELFIEPTGR